LANSSPTIKANELMKKPALAVLAGLLTTMLFSGCVASIGNRDAQRSSNTLGQQLIDLQKAKDSGAMTESEYEAQKAKLLSK
jgi:hypothetical protein